MRLLQKVQIPRFRVLCIASLLPYAESKLNCIPAVHLVKKANKGHGEWTVKKPEPSKHDSSPAASSPACLATATGHALGVAPIFRP